MFLSRCRGAMDALRHEDTRMIEMNTNLKTDIAALNDLQVEILTLNEKITYTNPTVKISKICSNYVKRQ